MADLTFTTDFAVPPNEIFVFFVPQRMPLWYGAEMDACFTAQCGAPEFCRGQRVRIAGKLGRRPVSLEAAITNYEFGRLLEWRFEDRYGVRGMQRWELAPAPSGGGTRLTMRDSYHLPGKLGALVDRVFTRRAVARRDRAWLARLERLVNRV
jgi:hypothetical protein